MINFVLGHVHSDGLAAEVTVTVTGGTSKNNEEGCQRGGGGFPIPYDCLATVRGGGSVSFMCTNQEIDVTAFGGTAIPEDVLTVKATLTPGGRINWNAFALNPQSGAPNAGELNPPEGTSLNTGSIMGIKMGSADWGDAMPEGWTCVQTI